MIWNERGNSGEITERVNGKLFLTLILLGTLRSERLYNKLMNSDGYIYN
jgi:hypothetical protein